MHRKAITASMTNLCNCGSQSGFSMIDMSNCSNIHMRFSVGQTASENVIIVTNQKNSYPMIFKFERVNKKRMVINPIQTKMIKWDKLNNTKLKRTNLSLLKVPFFIMKNSNSK